MSTNNKISNIVSSQVPFFVRNDHPAFITFLEKYYEYLEQNGKEVDLIKNLHKYFDVDESIDTFLQEFYETFIKIIPEDILADKKLVLKHAKELYLTRGTENSIRYLIRILFNQEVEEFYYPKTDILKASDGKWFIEKSLRITDTKVNGVSNNSIAMLTNLKGRRLTGNTSNALATIERIDSYYDAGTLVREVKISSPVRNFRQGETLLATFEENGTTKTFTANLFSGSITSVEISAPGTGYSVGDIPTLISNTGTGGVLSVSKVSVGSVRSLYASYGGAGFQANDSLLISGGGGSAANGYVSVVISDGLTHPNTYNIVSSIISLEANTIMSNNSPYETYAYQNLATQYVQTSNLTISTGSGATTSRINLSAWKANSNTFFEIFDQLNVSNSLVLVTYANSITSTINVTPALSGGLTNVPFSVIKKANSKTTIANAMNYFVYANTGPVGIITLDNNGNNYTSIPTVSVVGNTRILSMGILGAMNIAQPGIGYSIGDTIEFINIPGGMGIGASANVTNVAANGAITQVGFKEVPGHIIGGSGYSQNYLPIANVISSTGHGANIVVMAILGAGDRIVANTTTIGAIEEITILDGGSGYESSPTVDFTSLGDGTANVIANVTTGHRIYPGRYLNDDGFLSGYNFLQNRDYYQNYSYVVKLRKSIEDYRQALKTLSHPSGMKLFGEFLYQDNGGTSNSIIRGTNTTYSNTIYHGTYVATSNANGTLIIVSSIASRNVIPLISNTIYFEFMANSNTNLVNSYYTTSNIGTSNLRIYISNTSMSGTVSANAGNGNTYTLTGSGTYFTSNLKIGDIIHISGKSNSYSVGYITSNTSILISEDYLPSGLTGNTYYKVFKPANSNGTVYFSQN